MRAPHRVRTYAGIPMSLEIATGPVIEPVEVTNETGDSLRDHCRIDHSEEDGVLALYLAAARTVVEDMTGRALLTQTLRMRLDRFPPRVIEIPRAPVQSVSSVAYETASGTTTLVAGTHYETDVLSTPARVAPVDGASWPTPKRTLAAVTIEFVAGWTAAASVPAPLRQAVLLLAAHYYNHRDEILPGSMSSIPYGIRALLSMGRWEHYS